MQHGDHADTGIEPDAARCCTAGPVCSRFDGGWYFGLPLLLEVFYETGVDQQPVEAPRFRTVLAGIEHALAAQHDALLLLERRIERDARGFLDHQWQISPVDGVHHGRTLDRLEVDRIDRVI